jgi:tetratricopeptide (TPR) repeat protein
MLLIRRTLAACAVVLVTTASAPAQDLPAPQAERFAQGVADLKAGRLDAAEAAFRAILQAGSSNAPLHHNLAIVLQQRGRHAEALSEFAAASRLDPSYGPAHLLAGTSLVALGRYAEARTELRSAARLMPQQVDAYLQLASVCQRLDDRLCAADAYARVAQLAPGDAEYAYRMGSAHLEVSQWAYERLSTRHPDSARTQQAIGRELLEQHRLDQAIAAFERAIAADGTLPDSHLALARIHFEAGRVDEASRELDKELAIVPFSKEALALKARIDSAQPPARREPRIPELPPDPTPLLSSSGDPAIDAAIRERNWPDAERRLAAAIERQPAARDLLVLVARIFTLDNKPLNAAIALKKADAIAPLDRDLRFTLVLAYVRLGRPDWAEPELQRLVDANPDAAEYRYWLGRLAYDAGKYAAAIKRFDEALARDPEFMRAHDNLGLCYEMLDDPEKAIQHYREAIRLNRQAKNKSPWPPTNLGILLRQRGGRDEASALFTEALGYDPNFAKGHYELGILLDETGRTADAIRELERAATLDPSYADPHYVLARLYRRQGDAARADQALASFKRLRGNREPGSR